MRQPAQTDMVARPVLLVGGWLLGVTTATAVAWGAVQVVGQSVADRPVGALPGRTVEDLAVGTPEPAPSGPLAAPRTTTAASRPTSVPSSRPTAAPTTRSPGTAGRSTPATPGPSRPAASPSSASTTRTATFGATGGTVAVSCTGATAALRYASPAAGFTSEVEKGGPAEVEVRFASSDHESRIRVECVSGTPAGRVEEHPGSGRG